MYLQILLIVWGAFSIPAIAFQCGTLLPWLYLPSRCAGSGALWYPVLLLSILTDAWLAGCGWTTIPEMHVTQKQRKIIAGLFASRVLTCILTVIQLAFLAPALKDINQPRAMPNPTVLKQFVLNSSIITAALPLLYRTLAQYSPELSGQATVCTPDDRTPTTPLQELKTPVVTVLPPPTKFDGVTKETKVKSSLAPPANDDFSNRLSIAFNKEIGLAQSKV